MITLKAVCAYRLRFLVEAAGAGAAAGASSGAAAGASSGAAAGARCSGAAAGFDYPLNKYTML